MKITQAREAIRNYNRNLYIDSDIEKITIDGYMEVENIDKVTRHDAEALACFYEQNIKQIHQTSKEVYNKMVRNLNIR